MEKEQLKLPPGVEFQSNDETVGGNLNLMIPVVYEGEPYFLRQPKSFEEIQPTVLALKAEYQGLGFLAHGGSYRFRTLPEQVQFAEQCLRLGLPVSEPFQVNGSTLIRYIPGVKLSRYNKGPEAEPEPVIDFLETVVRANELGIILGDRWTPNAVVGENGRIFQIDFDIQLGGGPVARVFELAQAVHYGSQSGNQAVTETVRRWLHDRAGDLGQIYDLQMLEMFLENHKRYASLFPDMNPYPLILPENE